MRPKPYTWSRKPTAARRTYRSAKEKVKASAKARARQAAAKLRGHKAICQTCGKTARTAHHLVEHNRTAHPRTAGRKPAAAKVPFKGREHLTDQNGKRVRNRLEHLDKARQAHEQRTGPRTDRPKGAPKKRTGQARPATVNSKLWWKAHRMQHAAGILTRDGKRVPNASRPPRKVQPRTRKAPRVK